ncbi:sulfotransferase family protein [Acidithiobacillus caldus]|uniref:sulfotransferase family protein n=1 Tax=Acidithiobacillus caldus TaxID=33059 RepID=UPI0005A1759E|nr:sulfotransferase family protein [Acidithiobacillus caldus]
MAVARPRAIPVDKGASKPATVRFGFTAEDFPISSTFAVFLDRVTGNQVFDAEDRDWGDQITEKMESGLRGGDDLHSFVAKAQAASDRAFATPVGKALTAKAYNVFAALLAGNRNFLSELQSKNRFIFVVSAPRHGGSYLTKELLRALGKNHTHYPSYFIHDGFPDIRYDWISHDGMEVLPMTRRTIQQCAEWIVMADWFFREDFPMSGLRTIPKKATKAIYEARFFRDVFGLHAEYVVPVRHPVAACISLIDKAGGLPPNGNFPEQPRSAIERWVLDAWASDGVGSKAVATMPYFTAYLHYWNRYFQLLATNGLLRNNPKVTVLPYTADAFETYLQKQHQRFQSGKTVEPMHIKKKIEPTHLSWLRQSQPILEDMEQLWASFGTRFPLLEISGAL